jgi:hypothetical protein
LHAPLVGASEAKRASRTIRHPTGASAAMRASIALFLDEE